MESLKAVINNQSGHGYGISGKDVFKIIGGLLIAPVVVPVKIIVSKIKEKKDKK